MADTNKISGKVIKVLPAQSGTGQKEWTKQTFVIETGGQYPKKIAFTAWNDKCDLIPKAGTEVTVSYNPESREYNDKWYTDLSVWNIERVGVQKKNEPAKEPTKQPVKTGLNLEQEDDDDLPF